MHLLYLSYIVTQISNNSRINYDQSTTDFSGAFISVLDGYFETETCGSLNINTQYLAYNHLMAFTLNRN